MSLILDLVMGVLLGVLAVVGGSLMLGQLDRHRESVADWWLWVSMGALRRGLLVIPESGRRPKLYASRFDDESGGEAVRIDGSEKHFADPGGKMGELAGRPFGIVDARRNVILEPQDLALGQAIRDRREQDRLQLDREETPTDDIWLLGWLQIDDEPAAVPLTTGPAVVDGSADPGIASRTRTFIENSQSMFDSTQTVQQMIWLFAAGAGFGLVAIGTRLASSTSGAGGGITLPSPGLLRWPLVALGVLG